ncbi:MAG: phosphopantothenoylcysteine decarboxylase [Candidatus Omnitrophica bacterium]|nr:phosphopantothenoylcysteine decarboxylase [Candidatus Omnitrophota bacterium]
MTKKTEVVLGVTGSVAIYKACEIVRLLNKHNCVVSVVMTKEAEEFIRPLLFSSLSGQPVYTSMFYTPQQWEIEHISLAQRAEVLLIAPATANVIAKMAAGLCDDLLTCIALATTAPILVCPAMNEQMYKNPITQENIKKLKKQGVYIVEPRRGQLACGLVGQGCLASVEEIVQKTLGLIRK